MSVLSKPPHVLAVYDFSLKVFLRLALTVGSQGTCKDTLQVHPCSVSLGKVEVEEHEMLNLAYIICGLS